MWDSVQRVRTINILPVKESSLNDFSLENINELQSEVEWYTFVDQTIILDDKYIGHR